MEKVLGVIFLLLAILAALPIVTVVVISSFVASIPSRVGERIKIVGWIYRVLRVVADDDLMREFRDDMCSRIRPHLALEEDLERWYIIREMERDIQRINTALINGEYAIIIIISFSSIFIEQPIYGISTSVLLTLFALLFSGLVITRIVMVKILLFKPEMHMEEPTHQLAVKMAFNRGPLSRGASVGITILTVLIGISGGIGYDRGLDLVEKYAEKNHPSDKKKWMAE